MLNYKFVNILSLFIILVLMLGAVSASEDTNDTDLELVTDSIQNNQDGIKISSPEVEIKSTINSGT